MTTRCASSLYFAVLLLAACSRSHAPIDVHPVVSTDPVSHDPDDPAIWVHPTDPARSLILGTNKVPAPNGALVVFGLDGKTRQIIAGIDRPNNVDVEYGLITPPGPIDIAVVTERLRQRLRVFKITAEGLTDVSSGGGIPVFEGQQGERAEPMGIALYRRSRDGTVFAIVSRKTGPREGYLWQYDLRDDGTGRITGTKVREFGRFSGSGEIEAIAVDDALGYMYYADEGDGIHKWHADPDHPEAGRELAHFGREGFSGDREGIAIYARADGTGYIICTDQLPGNSKYHLYRREGKPGQPHDHSELLKSFYGGAAATDGIEASSANLGPQFPNGLLVVMNSAGRNFLIYRWEDIASFGQPKLHAHPALTFPLQPAYNPPGNAWARLVDSSGKSLPFGKPCTPRSSGPSVACPMPRSLFAPSRACVLWDSWYVTRWWPSLITFPVWGAVVRAGPHSPKSSNRSGSC